jgi:hypothetical protein
MPRLMVSIAAAALLLGSAAFPASAQNSGQPTNISPNGGAVPRVQTAPPPQQEQDYNRPYSSQGANPPESGQEGTAPYGDQGDQNGEGYDEPGQPYQPIPPNGPDQYPPPQNNGFSIEEITRAGGHFFGGVSRGLAEVIQYAFRHRGEPNGYILGQEAGGAFIAGLQYGEGTLYTRDAGSHQVFWQGPSLGYDFGAEGSKTMVLVYNLHSPDDIYQTFSGVDGSAYLVGGVGITFLTRGDISLAPIRSGIGLRLGANIGYLKYTRQPTWNPF